MNESQYSISRSSSDSVDVIDSRSATPVVSMHYRDPVLSINDARVSSDQIEQLPKRSTASLTRSYSEFSQQYRRSGTDRIPSAARSVSAKNSAATSRRDRPASGLHPSDRRSSTRKPDLIDELNEDPRFEQYRLLNQIGNRTRRHPWLLLPDDVKTYNIEQLYEIDDFTEQQVNMHEKLAVYNAVLLASMLAINIFGVRFINDDFRDIIGILLESYHSFRAYIMEMCEKNRGKAFYHGWHPLLKIAGMMALKIGLYIGVKQVCKWKGITHTEKMSKELETIVIDFDKHPDEPKEGGFGAMGKVMQFAGNFLLPEDPKGTSEDGEDVSNLADFIKDMEEVPYEKVDKRSA